ncbi:hypothetical protein V5O48_002074 [Marasmius crinis-equi]|uniref:BTB domain-containing protein n=1 Tax=Marasmius crinis-equi TaxID=585013 RepID=A0ABR3FWJ7_9AGAR
MGSYSLFPLPKKWLRGASQVDDRMEFRVHRHFLQRDSRFLRGMLSARPNGPRGSYYLPDVKVEEFESLLDFFYDGMYRRSPTDTSIQSWINLLSVSTQLNFPEVREHAIAAIDVCQSFGGQNAISWARIIQLAVLCDVGKWLQPAYTALSEREELISEEEAEIIGAKKVLLIARAREARLKERIRGSNWNGANPGAHHNPIQPLSFPSLSVTPSPSPSETSSGSPPSTLSRPSLPGSPRPLASPAAAIPSQASPYPFQIPFSVTPSDTSNHIGVCSSNIYRNPQRSLPSMFPPYPVQTPSGIPVPPTTSCRVPSSHFTKTPAPWSNFSSIPRPSSLVPTESPVRPARDMVDTSHMSKYTPPVPVTQAQQAPDIMPDGPIIPAAERMQKRVAPVPVITSPELGSVGSSMTPQSGWYTYWNAGMFPSSMPSSSRPQMMPVENPISPDPSTRPKSLVESVVDDMFFSGKA